MLRSCDMKETLIAEEKEKNNKITKKIFALKLFAPIIIFIAISYICDEMLIWSFVPLPNIIRMIYIFGFQLCTMVFGFPIYLAYLSENYIKKNVIFKTREKAMVYIITLLTNFLMTCGYEVYHIISYQAHGYLFWETLEGFPIMIGVAIISFITLLLLLWARSQGLDEMKKE